MREINSEDLNANLAVDKHDRVRQISHVDQPWESTETSPLMVAVDYLRRMNQILDVSSDELAHPLEKISFTEPRQQGVEYRLGDEKQMFDSSTIVFNQTYLNTPVWRAAITLTIKHNPNRVLLVENTSEKGMNAPLPSYNKIEEHKNLFAMAAADQRLRVLGLESQAPAAGLAEDDAQPKTAAFVRRVLGPQPGNLEDGGGSDDARAIRGRFFVYRYEAYKRLPKPPAAALPENMGEEATPQTIETTGSLPVLNLRPVDPSISEGAWRVVSEVTFTLTTGIYGMLNWRALIDVEKDSVLLLEPLVAGQDGFVFHRDPITTTGNTTNTPDRNNAILNPFRNTVVLQNLDSPVNGVQSLKGRFAVVSDVNAPRIDPPTIPTGTSFNFDVRTNDFAAVNAYYHTDRFFTLIESLGFPISQYFDHTNFPVRVDHRDNLNLGQNSINAWCVGNGAGGIGYAGYALNDLSDVNNPIGRACDSRVHLHELGGHGVLYEHVGTANFGFAHSAGDSLSAILHDPDSRLTGLNRFRYAPWNPQNQRRFDRLPADGWAWGGSQDDTGYGSEQILCTTMFRVYRSIGGDSADVNQKRFASRMVMYLILRAISTLTPATNPDNALGFANALMAVDLLNWTSEGVFGGAYNKVIRWSFEQQGLFQLPTATRPFTKVGQPPAVDVYIDDGRKGEYQYQPTFANNPSVWNRRAADNGTVHQEPVAGVRNFAYVRIRNRGTTVAQNVRVRGFHHKQGGGTVWPIDFEPLKTPELAAGTLQPRSQQARVVGPFEWIPTADALGHDSLMMVVSANGDSSNIDNFTSGESIPEWRLVPNDNNIGFRTVSPVAAESVPSSTGPQVNGGSAAADPSSPAGSAVNQLLQRLGLGGQNAKNIKVTNITFQVELDTDTVTPIAATGSWTEAAAAPMRSEAEVSMEASDAADWGVRRHGTIGTVAAQKIQSVNARNALARIFDESGESSLGSAAMWADLIKRADRPQDPATNRFLAEARNRGHNTWHYVNLPLDLDGYDRQLHPEFTRDNDIVQMIGMCIESLRSPGPGARFEEITALRWLSHLIGDLHQPIHIGCGFIANAQTNDARLVFVPDETIGLASDRGGGQLVLPIGRNLHEFWDSNLGPDIVTDAINAESDDALVEQLVRVSVPAVFDANVDPLSRVIGWANESLQAARLAYQGIEITQYHPTNDGDYRVSWEGEASYRQRCEPIVTERMAAASSNLASLLDQIWP